MSVKVYRLIGPGFCGRLVKLRDLTADERDAQMRFAAKEIDKDSTALEFQQIAVRRCVIKMIDGITKEKGLTKRDLDGVPESEGVAAVPAKGLADFTWTNPGEMAFHADPRLFGSFFGAKDEDLLARIYRRGHEPSQAEIDDIMGKAIEVSD